MSGRDQYIENIRKLTQATSEGKISWERQNPTTFYYQIKDSTISVQQTGDQVFGGTEISFSIVNSKTDEVILSLDDSFGATQALMIALRQLYNAVEFSVEKKTIDYFNDLMNDL